MEFNQKLQTLRKQRGLTQEELAAALYVSRTAISKWESGRGYPNLDSLKAIAAFFGVSVDDLLSGDQLLTIAQEEKTKTTSHLQGLVFGLLDVGAVLLLIFPMFGETANDTIYGAYIAVAIVTALFGGASLLLQGWRHPVWVRSKYPLSFALSLVGVLLFILSPQPYAAAYLFLFLGIKTCLLLKK